MCSNALPYYFGVNHVSKKFLILPQTNTRIYTVLVKSCEERLKSE